MKRERLNMRCMRSMACAAAFFSACFAAAGNDFFAIYGIPDHDQRRDDLPNNGGMYCVPTSSYNLINYMAQHGVPSFYNCLFDPGNAILNNNPYFGHSLRLLWMGAQMNTDPFDGTGGSGWTNGLIGYVESISNVPLMLIAYNRSENFPSPGAMLAWMRFGGLVGLCYGRYTNPNGFNKTRDGGHCVTLDRVWKFEHAIPNPYDIPWLPQSYYTYRIGYRDPASDEGSGDPARLTKQSPFATTVRDVYAEHANFSGTETTLYGIGTKPTDSTAKYAYIDGYRVIIPMVVLTNKVTSDNFQIKFALNFTAEKGQYSEQLGNLDLKIPQDSIGDFALDPIVPAFVHTVKRSNQLWQHELYGDTGRPLGDPFATRPIGLEYSGHTFHLFVLEQKQISKMDRMGKLLMKQPFEFLAESMAWDPVRRQLVVVGGTHMAVMNENLEMLDEVDIRELGGDGRPFLRFDPVGGDLFLLRRGSPNLLRFRRTEKGYSPGSIIPLPLPNPQSLDFCGRSLMVAQGGRLYQFDRYGKRTKGSPFDGAEVGPIVRFGRSYTNFTRGEYPLPEWRDLENPGVPSR